MFLKLLLALLLLEKKNVCMPTQKHIHLHQIIKLILCVLTLSVLSAQKSRV